MTAPPRICRDDVASNMTQPDHQVEELYRGLHTARAPAARLGQETDRGQREPGKHGPGVGPKVAW